MQLTARRGSSYFVPKFLLASLLLALLATISALMKRSRRFSRLGSAALMIVLMVGISGLVIGLGQVCKGIGSY